MKRLAEAAGEVVHHFTRRSRGCGERGEVQGLHFEKQLRTCLRLTDRQAWLLVNFNEALLKHGIKWIVKRLEEDPRRPPLPRVLRVKFLGREDLHAYGYS